MAGGKNENGLFRGQNGCTVEVDHNIYDGLANAA